jgi:hypothetical protein
MRTIKFRDILWGVAYKLGYDPSDPNTDFQVNEATAMTSFANAWLRRLWPSKDWPEWTFTEPRNPIGHIVPHETSGTVPSSPLHPIGTVRKVFLVDPLTTPGRELDTHFELNDQGIHCGFEHGPTVWIKFLPPCPQFSADQWSAQRTYGIGDLVYSVIAGNSFKSLSSGNIGHDPDVLKTPLFVQTLQQFVPAHAAIPSVTEKWAFSVSPPTWYNTLPEIAHYRFNGFQDNMAALHEFLYDKPVGTGMTLDQFLDNLIAVAEASTDTWINTSTWSKDTAQGWMIVERYESFLIAEQAGDAYYTATAPIGPVDVTVLFQSRQRLQAYYAGQSATPAAPQTTVATLPSTLIPNAIYQITIGEPNGLLHSFEYATVAGDDANTILDGIKAAFDSAALADTFLAGLTCIVDYAHRKLSFSGLQDFSLSGIVIITDSPYWEPVDFPFALLDQTIRGVYADMLKEDGQTDKGMAEEQIVPTENTAVLTNIATGEDDDDLTTQQITKPRYQS